MIQSEMLLSATVLLNLFVSRDVLVATVFCFDVMSTVLQVLHACKWLTIIQVQGGKKIKERDFCNWRWSAEEKGGERSNGSKFNLKCRNSMGGIGSGREEASCGAGDRRLKCSRWWVWKSREEGRVRNGDSFYQMWTPEVVGSTLLKVNVSFSSTAKI